MKPPRRISKRKLVKEAMNGCAHPDEALVRFGGARRPFRRRDSRVVVDRWCSRCGALHYIGRRGWRKPADFYGVATIAGLVGGFALLSSMGRVVKDKARALTSKKTGDLLFGPRGSTARK